MKIISFSWTTPALLAGRKTVTRRSWDAMYATSFHAGELVAAYNRSQRFGGTKVAEIQLTSGPYAERVMDEPPEDFEGEGFAFYCENPHLIPRNAPAWLRDITPENYRLRTVLGIADVLWVVRFRLVKVEAA